MKKQEQEEKKAAERSGTGSGSEKGKEMTLTELLASGELDRQGEGEGQGEDEAPDPDLVKWESIVPYRKPIMVGVGGAIDTEEGKGKAKGKEGEREGKKTPQRSMPDTTLAQLQADVISCLCYLPAEVVGSVVCFLAALFDAFVSLSLCVFCLFNPSYTHINLRIR